MLTLAVPDETVEALRQRGADLVAWTVAALDAAGFDLGRPLHYRYSAAWGTVITQEPRAGRETAGGLEADSELSTDVAWAAACEALAQEVEEHVDD